MHTNNIYMNYNTNAERLILPEYGRNIQNMVDYCLTIEDRDERNYCANSIINMMGNMFPHFRDINDFEHILWDHLAIMSDFKLDVDYPFEIVRKESLNQHPPRLPYPNMKIKYRHYGQIVENLIQKVTELDEGDEKEAFILIIANQMKKAYLTWNKDSVDDEKILKDLAEMSNGKIIRDTSMIQLASAKSLIDETPNNNTGKKKKKKKNK